MSHGFGLMIESLVAVLLLLTIGAIACLVPARRAVSVNPTVALKHE